MHILEITARNTHGSPPNTPLLAVMLQDDFPAHAAVTTAIDVAALHEGFTVKPVAHEPAGVPNEAKATEENVPPSQDIIMTPFSGAVAHAPPTIGVGMDHDTLARPMGVSTDADAHDRLEWMPVSGPGGAMTRSDQERELGARERPARVL